MAYRPYPCAERARRQLDRHTRPATVTGLDPLRGWSVTLGRCGAPPLKEAW
jgi:hypothetical protein